MNKVEEKNLKQVIEKFENKNIIIDVKSTIIKSIINIENLNIKYNYRVGYIYIVDNIHKNKLKINIAPAYNIEVTKDYTELLLQLDYDIDIHIKVK